MKAKTWILALALAASGYWIYQWLTQPIPNAFANGEPLLTTDTAMLTTIRINHSSGEVLTYSRESGRWLASNGQQSTWVDGEEMLQLLTAITELKTEGMVSSGTLQGTAVQVFLFGESQNEEAFQLRRTYPDTTWFGFNRLPEKYLVNADLTRPFFRTFSYYRPPRLVEWDAPDSLTLVRDSVHWMFYRADSSWITPPAWMGDSTRLADWVSTLSDHEAPQSTAPYDQQLPDSLVHHKLFAWDGGDQIRLTVYYRNQQWGIWSNQIPDQWHPEIPDSSYRKVFPAWLDSLMMPTEIPAYE